MRTSNGCWTCRLRRKKCDEVRPVCSICAALNITCHFEQAKPSWMDGGVKQDDMAHNIRVEIKTMAQRNRAMREVSRAGKKSSRSHEGNTSGDCFDTSPSELAGALPSPPSTDSSGHRNSNTYGRGSSPTTVHLSRPGSRCEGDSSTRAGHQVDTLPPLDSIHTCFYLDHLFPFLYPFYQPSISRGGRAWVLKLLMTSATFQQIALDYSIYFRALVWPDLCSNDGNKSSGRSTGNDQFALLRQSLHKLLSAGDLGQHISCACRVLMNIMQLHRYEISLSKFDNWRIHLDGASGLLKQLITECCSNAVGAGDKSEEGGPVRGLDTILRATILSQHGIDALHTTQEGFVFSAGLLLFDDIVAAVTSGREPTLYRHHQLLIGGPDPAIELENIVGIKSCVLKSLSEAASLNARKKRELAAGSLDGLALAQRASDIMESLATDLEDLEEQSFLPPSINNKDSDALEELKGAKHARHTTQHTRLISQVWAHATMIYLITVISGWQPASSKLQYHVRRIVEIISLEIPTPLIRTIVWPFYVAGCLADCEQKCLLRRTVCTLQPAAILSNVHRTAEILERVWEKQESVCDKGGCELDYLNLPEIFQVDTGYPLLL